MDSNEICEIGMRNAKAFPAQEDGVFVANILLNTVNNFSLDYKDTANKIARQSFLYADLATSMFCAVMHELTQRSYDARNEAAWKLAKKLNEENLIGGDFSAYVTGFAETVCSDHRTLQQSVVRLLLEILRVYDLQTATQEELKTIEEILCTADDFSMPLI